MMTVREVEWGHWWLSFWEGSAAHRRERGYLERCAGRVMFGVGAAGPCDGTVGSPERLRYQAMVLAWKRDGVLPAEVRP